MLDGIHDFTVINSQKNPSEQLIIVSWIAGALSTISEEMIESSLSGVSKI